MKQVAIGIDVGGTNTAIGVVNKDGNVLVKKAIFTSKHGDGEKYIAELSDAIKVVIEECRAENKDDQLRVLGIGIGAPNGNYYNGTIEYAPNLTFKGVVPVVELLKKHFSDNYVIALTNDANAAAIGEMIYGSAKKMKNFVMYTLGTGVGSGLVVNGELVYGADGFAGECGHTMLIPGGRKCGCGIRGHIEAYCSAIGMARTAFELMADASHGEVSESLLSQYSYKELTSKKIFEAATQGDKIALKVFKLTGQYLGQGLADTVHHLSPEAIFLFGGPTAAGDLIFKPTIKAMEEYLLPIFQNKIKVLPSKLKMGDAPIVGASALVWKALG